MDSIKSFKGYGKVDELEQQALQRKTRRRLIIIIVSSIILAAAIIGAVAGFVIHKRNSSSSSSDSSSPASGLTPSASLTALCSVTQYPGSCYSSLRGSNTSDPEILFKLSLRVAIDELSRLSSYPDELIAKTNDTHVKKALEVCKFVFDDAMDRLNDTVSSMEVKKGERWLSSSKIDDMATWLSSTITDQETCLDALDELNSTLTPQLKTQMQNSTEFASNSLAIVARILSVLAKLNVPSHRRLLAHRDGFPEWVSAGDRRLLQDDQQYNTTVAQDGTGDFKTITEAVNTVPKKSKTRFVIRVKQGIYVENVVLDKSKWNVMMIGDGKTKTIVSGKLNFVDGTPTFATATFGKGFIAKDMGFINTAGPEKHQAVAFRSGSDESVFYRCSFDAFQDTLYAHSNRQFYRECDITGTIDFIFGNAAVVFQDCNILPRQPLPNQFNTITAQGKKDINQNTGISIQKCTFSPRDTNLTAPTYLGRPWKDYSTTVIMQSDIGSFLQPEGWKEWVPNVDPPSSIFYAEYQNTGLGSNVEKRVQWLGYRPNLSADEAAKFSVASFIHGGKWLPEAGVEYNESL
ncbi:hypothetical protein TIFTF001_037889 [Ficus carica]|uniref:Pectinesterase n=1 Tax=Ficus carica TaxID=3494 RepID=A0AA88E7U2_FICCA|nr:hypothetical protein TIFTF001_037883 [Ficus carica]GMN68838.1 hypothetical protein TIFTF001_037889 [Ficus carica]